MLCKRHAKQHFLPLERTESDRRTRFYPPPAGSVAGWGERPASNKDEPDGAGDEEVEREALQVASTHEIDHRFDGKNTAHV
jgi:hypothetical protein